jgi:hypothetical protein
MISSMSRALRCALVLAAAFDLIPPPADAQIYRWVDEAGVPHFSEGLDTVPERHRATATPLGLRNRPAPAPAPDAVPKVTAPPGGTVVRYSPGQRIMVDVRINGAASARLMLDTGADRTIVSPRALTAAGVSVARTVATGQLVGVTGTDRLPYVMVDSLEVAEARVGPLPVGAYEMTQADSDGLLGRDFLDRFHVTIDAARGLVTLAPK